MRMAHFGEARRGRGADPSRRAVGANEIGKARLDRLVALTQRVIIGVGNLRRVFLMIELVVMCDLGGERLELGLRLGRGQSLDRSALVPLRLGAGRAHARAPAKRLAAAARASAVIAAPESMRAISSRRSASLNASTLVALAFLPSLRATRQ